MKPLRTEYPERNGRMALRMSSSVHWEYWRWAFMKWGSSSLDSLHHLA